MTQTEHLRASAAAENHWAQAMAALTDETRETLGEFAEQIQRLERLAQMISHTADQLQHPGGGAS